MSAIGSLLFCTDCGELLPEIYRNKRVAIRCKVCGTKNEDVTLKATEQHSKPRMFPSTLRNKNSNVQDVEDDDVQGEQTIDKTCPKCGNKQMKYYTVQIRSVDEGSTVFYTCEQCGHKENTNN